MESDEILEVFQNKFVERCLKEFSQSDTVLTRFEKAIQIAKSSSTRDDRKDRETQE